MVVYPTVMAVYSPKESVVFDAILPELFAAVVTVHVKANSTGSPAALLRPQLNIEPLPFVRDLLNMEPGRKKTQSATARCYEFLRGTFEY